MADNTTLSIVEAAVKEHYSGGIEDITNNASPSLKKVERGTPEELNSRSAALVIQPENNPSERWSTAEFQDFPAPGNSPYVKTTVPFVNVSATCQFSHHVLAENQNATTLGDLIQRQLDNKAEALMQSRNIFLWGDGSGERARVSGFNSGTGVVTCNNSGNLYGVQLLDRKAEVEFRDSSGVLKSGGGPVYGKISAISWGNLTITLDATVGFPNDIANGDRVYLKDSYNSAPRGFLYHVANSGAWQGLSDRTIYKNTSAPIQSAASAVLSAGLMDKMLSAQAFKRQQLVKGKMRFYASTQYFAYLATGYEMKIANSGKEWDGTYEQIAHSGVPIEWEPHVQRDMMWGLDMSFMRWYAMQEIKMVKNSAGGIFHQQNAANGTGHASGKYVYWEGFMNYGVKDISGLGTRLYSLSTASLDLGNNA